MSGVTVTFYLIHIESPEEVEVLDSAGDLLGVSINVATIVTITGIP